MQGYIDACCEHNGNVRHIHGLPLCGHECGQQRESERAADAGTGLSRPEEAAWRPEWWAEVAGSRPGDARAGLVDGAVARVAPTRRRATGTARPHSAGLAWRASRAGPRLPASSLTGPPAPATRKQVRRPQRRQLGFAGPVAPSSLRPPVLPKATQAWRGGRLASAMTKCTNSHT